MHSFSALFLCTIFLQKIGPDHVTMGISACEKCINKKDETQNKGKKWSNLASFFGQKSLKY